MRTIYKQHAQSLFKKNFYKRYIKPTEGISNKAYKDIMKVWKDGGMWVWICSSQTTEKTAKKSFVYGAVFISDIISTAEFKKQYKNRCRKPEFKYSVKGDYQAIIPEHEYARLELVHPLPLHSATREEKDIVQKKTAKAAKAVKAVRATKAANKQRKQCAVSKSADKDKKKCVMEMRINGVWTPFADAEILEHLKQPIFV